MFDAFAQTLFDNLPALDDLTPHKARRMLSRTYLAIIELRTSGVGPSDEAKEAVEYLRRLADTIEFYAVLDETVQPDIRHAGAFVAAESLALLADFYDREGLIAFTSCRLRHNGTYTRVEAAILYLIAGYDACAGGVAGKVESDTLPQILSPSELGAEWCLKNLMALCQFRLNPLPEINCNIEFGLSGNLDAITLEDDSVGRLYAMLGKAVSIYLHWLAGESIDGDEVSDAMLKRMLDSLESPENVDMIAGIGGDYGRIRHLAELLRICFPEIGKRALVHVVPKGPGFSLEEYSGYLRYRARGDLPGGSGRPVLCHQQEPT